MMHAQPSLVTRGLFAGSGEMAARMAAHDWSATPLGPPSTWPTALTTLVGIMLGSKQPMFVAWGADRTMLYNDGYAAVMGGKHPGALGSNLLQVWSDIRGDLQPLVDQVDAGESVNLDDLTLITTRNGFPEETHFAFSYTPVRDETGRVAGLFCPCTEITGQVMAERELRAERDRSQGILASMNEGFALLDSAFRVIDINAEGLRLEARPASEIIGRTHWEAWPGSEESDLGQFYKTAMRDRVAATYEHRYTWPDGREAWLEVRAYPSGDGLALFFRDVSERRRAEEAVRESEDHYRHAVELNPQTVWTSGPDGQLDRVGQRWTEWTGTSGLGDSWGEAIHPDDLQPSIEAWTRSVTTGEPYHIEHRVRMQDGVYHWMLSRAYPRRDEAGRVVKWYGTTEDVNEQKLAETALEVSEARFQAIVDSIDQMIWSTRPDGHHDYFNQRWYEFTGMPAGSTEGEGWSEMFHPTTRREHGRPGDTASRQASPTTSSIGFGTIRGSTVGCSAAPRPCATSRGGSRAGSAPAPISRTSSPLATCWPARGGVGAPRRRAHGRARSGLAALAGPPGRRRNGWVTGGRQRGMDRAPRLGGAGVGWLELREVHPSRRPGGHARGVCRIFHEPLTRPYEYRLRHKDGTFRRFAWTAVLQDGRIYASGRHTTFEHEQAEALHLAEDALRQAQKMEAVGQLTGGIAHDFNNLLAGIVGSLDLMQMRITQGRTEDIERYAKAAMSSAQRAAALTHRLLAFSRRQPLDPKPVNANQLVTGMEDLLRRSIGPLHALEFVTAGGLWTTLCDPNQLESAILNLAINARDAMPDGGKLTIETCNAHLDSAYAASSRDVTPGAVYLHLSDRHRHRHGAGRDPEGVRTLLHHQAARPGHRPRPVDGLRLRQAERRARQDLLGGRPGHDGQDLPAASSRGCRPRRARRFNPGPRHQGAGRNGPGRGRRTGHP
jgi:PAS domain S-box-containing protein